ncbi:MAG TPA: tetraacyldisaccharide 4'-kinase [Alphaproteobacteria bacterium]|nr:tetraacyldisaccharide 4'-kinase [Alphaproteobacteria bacterium]
MKVPAFWYRRPGLCAVLLWPLSLIWRLGAFLRRAGARPYRTQVPAICVGNVVVGGAGKTPAALAIAHILQQAGKKPVFVTRGFGGSKRKTDRVDLDRHSALDVGDEALLLAGTAPTFIGRNRAAALRVAERHGNATHLILDDGLQNPHIAPDLAFIVIDGETGIGNGFVMPAGPLRESLASGLRRAAAVILIGSDTHNLAARISTPILRAHWQADLADDFPRDAGFLAFAGIGRPEKFYATCRAVGLALAATRDFADHHYFATHELQRLHSDAGKLGARLLTTEKDWVRLPINFRAQVLALPARLVFEDETALKRLLNLP